jgi:hypothetical protein
MVILGLKAGTAPPGDRELGEKIPNNEGATLP